MTCGEINRTYHLIIDHKGHICQVNVSDISKNRRVPMPGDIVNYFFQTHDQKIFGQHVMKNPGQNLMLMWY